MKRRFHPATLLLAGLVLATACKKSTDDGTTAPAVNVTFTPVATSQVLWTGVAVTRDNRLFANFPRMDTDTIPYSVAEVSGAQATPFPDANWNTWAPGLPPGEHFICVQSVYADANNALWVLDAANPQMRGVVPGGPKLLKFDPNSRQLLQRIVFDETVAPLASYLNDVRVDTDKNVAYITESGRGAIIVVNLNTGKARRLLANSPTTKSENLILTVEGRIFRQKDGSLGNFNADGIALSPKKDYLYYHSVTARALYRIATATLLDESLTDAQVNSKVEYLGDTDPVDGMEFGRDSSLYLTYVQQNAIARITPRGQLQGVVRDSLLKWPDSFALATDGSLYVTNSQLHIPRAQRTQPFRIFKLNLTAAQ
jgi:sugar lactone lactonase YvrE